MMCSQIEPVTIESLLASEGTLAICAILVSFFGLLYSMWFNRKTLRLTKEHNKKMVTPNLVLNRSFDSVKNFNYSCDLKNVGLGPAIIVDIKFDCNGTYYKNFNDLFREEINGYIFLVYDNKTKYSKLDNREVLAPNGNQNIHFTQTKNGEGLTILKQTLAKTTAIINYQCIYGEKYIYKEILNPS